MFAKTLVALAAFAAVATAAPCGPEELTKLAPLAIESQAILSKCTADSGFALIPPSGLPSDDQLKKMCVSDACKQVIEAVKAKNPSDCDLTVGVTINVNKLVANFPTDCARVLGSGSAPTQAPTQAPPASTTSAPTPGQTTAAPTPGQTTAKPPVGQTTPAPVDNSC